MSTPSGVPRFFAGVAYGPYRRGQSPGGAQPSPEEILEDLRLMAARWDTIRVYGSRGVTRTILGLIRSHALPIRVMLGAWVAGEGSDDDGANPDGSEAREENDAEVEAAIQLANTFPDIVFAVCVGNETQVTWSAHRMDGERLLQLVRRVRDRVGQPVTTADDFSFWIDPASRPLARELDFLVVHAHPLWNRQTLTDAVPWTERQLEQARAIHPEARLVLGETGWATDVHLSGDAARQITAEASEASQATFFHAFRRWATTRRQPYFFFEAFDEPWKGGPHPSDVEKHWGLFRADRTPKRAISHAL